MTYLIDAWLDRPHPYLRILNRETGEVCAMLEEEALDAIAGAARLALDAQAGVDLDAEAVNLVRFQQAFQASSKAIQVASDLFDTLLAIR